MIKGFLIDLEKGARVVEFEDTLQNIYDLLGVGCIDVAERKVGDGWYDFVVDDEGLLKEDPIPSVFDSDYQVALVGNVLIVHHDEQGNFTSIDDNDIDNIQEHLLTVLQGEKMWRVLVGADYE